MSKKMMDFEILIKIACVAVLFVFIINLLNFANAKEEVKVPNIAEMEEISVVLRQKMI